MTRLSLVALTFAAGYALLYQGAAEESRWVVCQIAIAAIALCQGLAAMRKDFPKTPPLDRWLAWILSAVVMLVVLQLVPLPLAVLRVIAPGRAELTQALSIAGIEPGWAPVTVAPWATEAVLRRWLAAGLVFLIVRSASARFGPRSWWPAMPVLLLALAEGATGIAQKLLGVTVQGTYGNRNHFAALIAAALPFALSGALYLMGRRLAGRALRSGEALAGLCVVPCVSVLAISGIWSLSRMGFIAMAASIAVVGWHALRRQTGRPVLSAALLSGALFTGMAAMAPAELIERFALTNDLQAGDNRISLWRESLELVKASPLVGSGLGAYEPAFLRYKRVAPDRSADFAHNDFLQLSAELGLAGVALIVVAVSRLLVPLLRRAYCGSDGSQWLRVACLASLVGMGLHSASDYPLYVPGNLVLTAWVGGIAAFQIAKVKPAVSETDV